MALYKNNTSTGELNLLAGSAAVDNKLNKDSSNPVQNKIITTKIDELEKSFAEAKKSVSDGKMLVATAITDKGVATSQTDSFATMAENIGQIKTGGSEIEVMTNTTKGAYNDICSSINVDITTNNIGGEYK